MAPSNLYCGTQCAAGGFDNAYYLRTYGITKAEVDRMREEQRHLCALCETEGFLMRGHHRQRLVIDHCHRTGRVRRLLCHNCNRALGLFQDNPDVLRKAAAYVEEFKEGATTIPEGSTPKRAEAHSPL